MSNKTKKKISLANKGNKNCLGRKLSAQTKEKLRNFRKGTKQSEETKNKIKNSLKLLYKTGKRKANTIGFINNIGKKLSEETKRRISQTKLLRKHNLINN